MIGRASHANTAARRAARRRVPGNVDIVSERTAGVRVRRYHWLIVEMIAAVFKGKKGDCLVSLAPIGGACDRHFAAIDAVAIAEVDDDIAIEQVVLSIKG